jgi:CheY-like chemotaxis protein
VIQELVSRSMGLKGLRVLLVEDEAMVAMLIEAMLEELGCTVVQWVADVPDALRAVERTKFDCALLDVNLGGSLAYPVAERLATQGLPFAFVTGYGHTIETQCQFPRVPILKKPFETDQLRQLLSFSLGPSR